MSFVQSSIAIRVSGEDTAIFKQNIPLVRKTRYGSLAEDLHLVFSQTKVVVIFKFLPHIIHSGRRSHDIPTNLSMGQIFQLPNPFSLKLNQTFLTWQTNIKQSLGFVRAQPRPLPSSKEYHAYLISTNSFQTNLSPGTQLIFWTL